MTDLSDQVLATWGSSVCAGFEVPTGTGWPWLLGKKLAEIKGPKVTYASTPGDTTDSKESKVERDKVASANLTVVCLSLGNQGLGSAATDASAKAIVDSYVDDIFTDTSTTDGDPESLVNYIKSLGAFPIVTLVYSMADYNTMHCHHVVEANILQQSFGIPTINHLGATNAGNNFDKNDCKWADGSNAPVNVESDARHPNQLGHTESFYAFPPDLPFALASGIPFPTRPKTTDYYSLSQTAQVMTTAQDANGPIAYTPQYATHNYTMQFGFKTSSDGTLATIDLGMNGAVTIELQGGLVHLAVGTTPDALQGKQSVTDDAWHDVAVTYSYVRQKVALYIDGDLTGEHDARDGTSVRELFPQRFALGGSATSGGAAAPASLQLRDLFINRSALHSREIEERATTDWVGAGSLDVYAPLRTSDPTVNLAQTLQTVNIAH